MRIAKPLLMISLSVFLFAVSWSLLTGQLGLPRPAHAQMGSDVVHVEKVGNTSGAPNLPAYMVITADGSLFSFTGDLDISSSRFNGVYESVYAGNVLTGAVPTADQSASGLKSRYGGDN